MRRSIDRKPFLIDFRNGRNGKAIPGHETQWWWGFDLSFLTFLAIPKNNLGMGIYPMKSNVPAFLGMPTPKGVCARALQGRRTPTLGAEMTTDDEHQFTEQDGFIAYLMAKVDASESLVSDLLGMMVALDPTSMAELRDHAFRQVSMVERVGRPTPEALHYGAVLQKRAQMLEVVVQRAGLPWRGTPLIDLAEARAGRS